MPTGFGVGMALGFGRIAMGSPGLPLYQIIFASKHERGLEFWNKVTKKDRGGQRDLFSH